MKGSYYLGIDGGGTKTEAILLDCGSRKVARAASGPSNYHSVGCTLAQVSLREAIDQVLTIAGLATYDVTAIGLGVAGIARPGDREVMQALVSQIACFARVVITHDAEAALVGGVGRRHGVVLIAGTGAMAYGINAQGETRRADGWGYLMGDEGSAHWIGQEGLRAIARAHDGRGRATDLERIIVSHLALPNTSALVPRIYGADFGVTQVAGLAPLVRLAAQSGDAVARGILQEAGRRLGNTARAVIYGLEMTDETFEIVLTGGVFRVKDLVWATVVTALNEIAPCAQVIEPRHDAAFGAALLAQQSGE